MSLGEGNSGPGQGSAPAFFLPSRDFPGGLLVRYQFVLTQVDADACLRFRFRREHPVWHAILLVSVGIGLFALTLMVFDRSFYRLPQHAAVWVLVAFAQYIPLRIFTFFRLRRQVRRLLPQPRHAMFEEWTDCVAGNGIDDGQNIYLSPELIGEIVETRFHIFILSGGTTIILPRRVFTDNGEAGAMVAHLRQLAKGPYYFDP